MTTLAVATPQVYELGDHNDIGVIASDIIYEGSAVGDNASGYARPLVAGDPFLGFAQVDVDNSSGSAGDKSVRVNRKGAIQLAVTSVAITDVGRPVYASDDNTFALAGIGTKVGYVKRFVSSGVAIVAYSDEPEIEKVVGLPLILANVADGDLLTDLAMTSHGRIKKVEFATTIAVTTGSKLSSLAVEIGATATTGGVVSLTSANATPIGKVVAGSAITALAGFKKGDTLTFTAASTTTFIEGEGVMLVTIGL